MTVKEQYEARKAERKRLAAEFHDFKMQQRRTDAEMTELIDRFVTAVERIADALEGNL